MEDKQKDVIRAVNGHYIVLAGPGCGKTHTITEKISYIIRKEIIPEPYKLLAVTFTDNAARTMRARLLSNGFTAWDRVWIGTYHGFGSSILRSYGNDVGVREDFTIIEKEQRNALIENIAQKYFSFYILADLIAQFDRLKREGIYFDRGGGQGGKRISEDLRKAYMEYNERLRQSNQVDFGDLIAMAVRLLKESELVKRLYTQNFKYVIVDEFQDSDSQQLEMIHILAKSAVGSTVVGDDDQSIYGWRGALRQNIDKIKKMLGSTEIILGACPSKLLPLTCEAT